MTSRAGRRTDSRQRGRAPCPTASLVPNPSLGPGDEPTRRNFVVFRAPFRSDVRKWGEKEDCKSGRHGAKFSLSSGMPEAAVQQASRGVGRQTGVASDGERVFRVGA